MLHVSQVNKAYFSNKHWGKRNMSNLIEKQVLGWRDGSAVKSTDCSFRGPEFNSQQSHVGSQPSVMAYKYSVCTMYTTLVGFKLLLLPTVPTTSITGTKIHEVDSSRWEIHQKKSY